MASTLAPSDPTSVMNIREVSPNITTLSLPFLRFGRIKIGGRATLIKLPSGAVAVFSPVALTDEVKSRVSQMGRLSYIIANDLEHHLWVGTWKKEYPEAKCIGPEELPAKKRDAGDSVEFHTVFKSGETRENGGLKVDEEFDQAFDAEYVPSHGNKELVFNYKPEKTLVQADLFFNLPAIEQYSKSSENPHTGFLTRLFSGLNGTSGSALNWQRRFIWYGVVKDRKGFQESIKRIDGWDFDKVIPCHGDVIESGGKGVFRSVFQWQLK